MKTRRQIMIEAHRIARTLEGNYIARLSEGLKQAWANREVKQGATIKVDMVEKITAKAILVRIENQYSDTKFWLPKSQIESCWVNGFQERTEDEISMPSWLANKLVQEGYISRIQIS